MRRGVNRCSQTATTSCSHQHTRPAEDPGPVKDQLSTNRPPEQPATRNKAAAAGSDAKARKLERDRIIHTATLAVVQTLASSSAGYRATVGSGRSPFTFAISCSTPVRSVTAQTQKRAARRRPFVCVDRPEIDQNLMRAPPRTVSNVSCAGSSRPTTPPSRSYRR